MRKLLLVVFTLLLAFGPVAEAKEPLRPAETQQVAPNEADLQTHKHYTNKSGQEVHSPSKSKSDKAPQGVSAKCHDGSYSFSTHHRGTCSHHGGVAQWLQ